MTELEHLRREAERLRRENAALARDRELFRSVFTEGNLGIALIGRDLRIEHANPALAQMLGREREHLIGIPVAEITHPDDVNATADLARLLLNDEISSYRVEKRYFHKDGSIVWAHLTATAIRDSDGKPLFGLAMIEDISARKRHSEEREQLILQLQEALKSVKTLSGLLPMCAWCRRIRDDGGYWSDVENYVRNRTDADFTHGICPQCRDDVRKRLGLPADEPPSC